MNFVHEIIFKYKNSRTILEYLEAASLSQEITCVNVIWIICQLRGRVIRLECLFVYANEAVYYKVIITA